MNWNEILTQVIYPALSAGLLTLLTWITSKGVALLNAKLKESMHFRGASVVADALTEAVAVMGNEIMVALADGKLSADEKKAIKEKAAAIAKNKLKRLAGFYKSDLVKWIDEQLEVGLGKLLLHAGLKKNL